MSDKNTAVFGIYPNRDGAERGVDALKAAQDISSTGEASSDYVGVQATRA